MTAPIMLQQAQLLADRLQHDCGDEQHKQITRAFWLCYGREPSTAELSDSTNFIASEGIAAFCRAMLNSNEFVFLP